MITRTQSIIQLLVQDRNLSGHLWMAAMARQTLAQMTSASLRNMVSLGYEDAMGTSYSSDFYGLQQVTRRPSVSLSWAVEPIQYLGVQEGSVTWRHMCRLVPGTRGYSNDYLRSLFCIRNSSASYISWLEDPSLNLSDYVIDGRPVDRAQGTDAQFMAHIDVGIMFAIWSAFASVCYMQACMFGPEARAIPDFSPLLTRVMPLLTEVQTTLISSLLKTHSGLRLLMRSYITTMESTNGSESIATAGDTAGEQNAAGASGPGGSEGLACAAAEGSGPGLPYAEAV